MRSDEEYAAAIFAARAALVDAVNAARHAGLTIVGGDALYWARHQET